MADLNLTAFAADSFDAATLTTSINAAPYAPGVIARRKLFREVPMNTTEAQVEIVSDEVRLIQSSPRGGPAPVHPRAARNMVSFQAPHLRTRDTLLADSWQNRRGFSEATLADVQRERDRVLASMRGSLETTLEYHRVRALSGQVLDADGSVMVDLLAEFGVAQNTHDMNLDVTTTNVANQIIAAKRKAESALRAATPTAWVAFASAGFMDALRAHSSVSATHEGWIAAAALSADLRDGFSLTGVLFIEVRNPTGVTMIEANAAYLVPEGVPDMFLTHFAPADYADTVNNAGLPLYARAQELPFNRGWMLESQSNPVSIVTRPRAVVKLTA